MATADDEPRPAVETTWANPVQVVGLLLSRFCVARCEHCGSNAGPEQRGSLPLALADLCLTGAAELGLDSVVISGGEPMALPGALRGVMRAAADKGLGVQLCSNGFWAKDAARADKKIHELRTNGLVHLMLSTDRFHLRYVELESVINAAQAAARAGLSCQIAVPSLRGDLSSLRLVSRLQAETSAHVYTHPIHPIGRGADLPLRQLPVFSLDPEPCGLVGHIEVDVDGTVAVCPTSTDFDSSSPMKLGNLTVDPWKVIIDRYIRTPWFFVVGTRGPVGLWSLLEQSGVDTATTLSDHHHACQLCEHLNHATALASAFEQHTGIDLFKPVSTDVASEMLERIDRAPRVAELPHEQPVELVRRAASGSKAGART